MRRWNLTWFAFIILFTAGATLAKSQAISVPTPNDSIATTSDYAGVMVGGRKLFEVMGGSGLSATERADRINRRLKKLIVRDDDIRPFNKQDLVEHGNVTNITFNGETILSVTDSDAQDALSTREELALLWGGKMATAVTDARAARANPLEGTSMLIRSSFSDLFRSLFQWLPRLAGAIVLFALFWLLARLNRWGMKLIVSHTSVDGNIRQLLRAFAYYGTWAVGTIAILSTLGLDGGNIATTLGISGFVLGFACKDVLSNFFAGLMLLLGRQFHIGDQIVVKEFEGTVERIELRALFLRTYDNRLVIIPNSDVFTSIVTSNTDSPHRRRDFVIGIGYEDDIARAQTVALETLSKVTDVAKDPPPSVLVEELAASTVNLRIFFHTHSLRADYLKVGSECMLQVKEAFDREKISMPTNNQSIVIQNLDQFTDRLEAIIRPQN